MTARVLPFTHKSAAIYDAAVAQALGDIMPIFEACRNGMAVKPVRNSEELIDGIAGEES